MESQYSSILSEWIERKQVEQSRREPKPVCRWCDNTIVEVDIGDAHGQYWAHEEGSYFRLYCPRCHHITGSCSTQADCSYCGYNIGTTHLAEPRRKS